MAMKTNKPTSPGRRFGTYSDFSDLTATRPEKSLIEPLKKTGGRNNQGRITARFRGGGAKRFYRRIDFKRRKDDVPARVATIEYDPNRSGRIALLFYADGEKRYILAPEGLTVGMTVRSGPGAELTVGNCLPLANIPAGETVHNIELQPGRGGQVARSAGNAAVLTNKEDRYAVVTLPSGEVRKFLLTCRATLGRVSNSGHQLLTQGKAGRNRHRGRRPHNRGTSMNPVSHPMGGGEGRTGGGRHPCSPTGRLSKGGRTRSPRKASSKLILRPRKGRR